MTPWALILSFLAVFAVLGLSHFVFKSIRAKFNQGSRRIKDGSVTRERLNLDVDQIGQHSNIGGLDTPRTLSWPSTNASGLVRRICCNKREKDDPIVPIELGYVV
jgi:hypothetical protein